jgi:hypothetical protein
LQAIVSLAVLFFFGVNKKTAPWEMDIAVVARRRTKRKLEILLVLIIGLCLASSMQKSFMLKNAF